MNALEFRSSRGRDARRLRLFNCVAAIAIASLSMPAPAQTVPTGYTSTYNGRVTQGVADVIVYKAEQNVGGPSSPLAKGARAAAYGSVPIALGAAAADGNKTVINAGEGAVIGGGVSAAGAGVACVVFTAGACAVPILAAGVAGGVSGALFSLYKDYTATLQDGVPVGSPNSASGPDVQKSTSASLPAATQAAASFDFVGTGLENPGNFAFINGFSQSNIPAWQTFPVIRGSLFYPAVNFALSDAPTRGSNNVFDVTGFSWLSKPLQSSLKTVCPASHRCFVAAVISGGSFIGVDTSTAVTGISSVPILKYTPVIQVGPKSTTANFINNPGLDGKQMAQLSDEAISKIANQVSKYLPSSVGVTAGSITASDVGAAYERSGNPRPTAADLYTPLSPPGSPIPAASDVTNVITNATTTNPSYSATDQNTRGAADNPVFTREVDPTDAQKTSVVSAIIQPVRDLIAAIPKPQISVRSVACPALDLDLTGPSMQNIGFGYHVVTDFHCQLAAKFQSMVQAFILMLAGLTAWRRVMSA